MFLNYISLQQSETICKHENKTNYNYTNYHKLNRIKLVIGI